MRGGGWLRSHAGLAEAWTLSPGCDLELTLPTITKSVSWPLLQIGFLLMGTLKLRGKESLWVSQQASGLESDPESLGVSAQPGDKGQETVSSGGTELSNMWCQQGPDFYAPGDPCLVVTTVGISRDERTNSKATCSDSNGLGLWNWGPRGAPEPRHLTRPSHEL